MLGDDPLSGHVFLFLNRRGCQVKMLVWTRGGLHHRAQASRARTVHLPRTSPR
ncbi:MAG: IS66 family insertion sequence element accessory protein TnpB [Polyangiaceae bacterium]|nr:IS66 family insertion sequence element accessory protein TnpB [Polyangiaceae bacterium]